ncbi:MAG: hypothetical protein QXZ59_03975 [Nitrososphaeria archaeon]
MKSFDLIEALKASKNSVFSIEDIIKITNKNENYVKILLNRLIKRNLLNRIEKNKYVLPHQNPYTIASSIIFPSYISFISAYSYYNLTTQMPTTIFIVSLKQKKELSYNNHTLKFIKFAKTRFFGYKKDYFEGKTIFVAELEKAILDSLYLPKYTPIAETFNVIKEAKLEEEKLIDYSKKYNSKVVIKRLGFLLETADKKVPSTFKKMVNKNYELLSPIKPPTGKKDEKWKMIVNEVLE